MRAPLVLAALLLAIPARAKVWAVVTPASVQPGGVFQIKAGDTANPEATAVARFRGTTIRLVPVRGVLRALSGVYAGTTSGRYPVAVTIGRTERMVHITVKRRYFPSQNIRMQSGKTGLMSSSILARERTLLNSRFDIRSPVPLWTAPFAVPARGPSTSPWGRRRTVHGRPWGQHQGADIKAPAGSPVVAANAGQVVLARRLEMRGNTVVLDHGLGVFSMYNHLQRLYVSEGDSVSRGERLGLVGSTGFSSGPHLHWEMRIGRVSVEPWPVVKFGLPLG